MESFLKAVPSELGNAQELIGKDMMLITVSDGEKVNAMTASWGCLGVLWNKNVAVCFVRESRYTYGLLENTERFSMAFFGGGHRDAIAYCGKVSGRDSDKLSDLGLHTEKLDGVDVIKEAEIVLVCKKLYGDMIRPECFIDKELVEKCYKDSDYHKVYVCEIESVYVKTK